MIRTMLCAILVLAAANGDGVDKALRTLKAKNKLYEDSLGGKTFNLAILDCFADQVKLRELPYNKREKPKEATVDREQLKILFEQRLELIKDSRDLKSRVHFSLTYDLRACKWKREKGTAICIGTPPPDEGRPKSKITFTKQSDRYVVSAFEAASPASGE